MRFMIALVCNGFIASARKLTRFDGGIRLEIRTFVSDDTEQVIALWHACELVRPWNDPLLDIERKVKVDDNLFLVGEHPDRSGYAEIVASVMGGYDGHRGWMNYLAVSPGHQRQGYATDLINHLEAKLLAIGCPKINLQIRTDNIAVQAFYKNLGFGVDDAVSMGKRLIPDLNPDLKIE